MHKYVYIARQEARKTPNTVCSTHCIHTYIHTYIHAIYIHQVVIGRELGMKVEVSDVSVESLLPEKLSKWSPSSKDNAVSV